MSGRYDDIINLPHHVSATRAHMPMRDRAAQFAPFAALVGHDAAIRESARLTDCRIELGDSSVEALNAKLQVVQENIAVCPEITVVFFSPDEAKSGGKYVSVTGRVKDIDEYRRLLIMQDGKKIAVSDICDLSGGLIDKYFGV